MNELNDAELRETQPSPRRRWRVALSVRAFMVIIAVVGGVLGWVMHRARVQREAVAAIQSSGGEGRVFYEQRPAANGAAASAVSRRLRAARDRLEQWVGRDYFETVTGAFVGLRGVDQHDALMRRLGRIDSLERLTLAGAVRDHDLAAIEGLRSLKSLVLASHELTGNGLKHVRNLSRLEVLEIQGSPITDGDLAHLANLRALKELKISGAPLTGAGLVYLKGLTHVETWKFMDCPNLNDAGFAQLGGLTRLAELSVLSCPAFTGTGLSHVDGRKGLSRVTLFDCPSVGDEALACLESATGLVTLNLNETGVTDRGLPHLYGMKKLREIDLEISDVSDEGVAELKRHCPSLVSINH
jgi:hypothetical protein